MWQTLESKRLAHMAFSFSRYDSNYSYFHNFLPLFPCYFFFISSFPSFVIFLASNLLLVRIPFSVAALSLLAHFIIFCFSFSFLDIFCHFIFHLAHALIFLHFSSHTKKILLYLLFFLSPSLLLSFSSSVNVLYMCIYICICVYVSGPASKSGYSVLFGYF